MIVSGPSAGPSTTVAGTRLTRLPLADDRSPARLIRRPSSPDSRTSSWLLAATGVLLTTMLVTLWNPTLWHWMLAPTALCGVLVAVDAAEWLLGKLSLLDPRAIIGVFGVHFFYLAPLLHVVWDHWPRYAPPADDWRNALGTLALLNCAGLLIYRFGLSLKYQRPLVHARRELHVGRFSSYAGLAVMLGLTCFLYVLWDFGGPAAFLRVVTSGREALAGYGWLLLLAESWPLLLFTALLVRGRSWLRRHLLVLAVLFFAFLSLQFLVGGLRGSRSNTVWPALIALGMVHLLVVPLRRRVVVAGALLVTSFMYLYGFYKSAGSEAIDVLTGTTKVAVLSERTGRDLPLLVLEDFGRAGTQAMVVDRQLDGSSLGWGVSYLGDVVKLLPDALLTDAPPDKVELGTDVLYGEGATFAGRSSSRVYGLVGEAMLNFGLIGGVLAFVPFTLAVRLSTRMYRTAEESGSLVMGLFAPLAGVATVVFLMSDVDNLAWFLLKHALPLVAVVVVSWQSFNHGAGCRLPETSARRDPAGHRRKRHTCG